MNTITTLKLHFHTQREPFAHNLYARWDNFFANNIERVADETLDKLRMENYELRIEKLELELGNIPEEDFEEQFPLRFREKLEEAVIQWKEENQRSTLANGELRVNRPQSTEKSSPLAIAEPSFSTLHFQLSILCYFLLHGSLPWYATKDCGNIRQLFLNVLQQNAKELKQFLQTYGHYTSLQQRLVYQLNDPELEKGVQLLAPQAGNFIIAYIHFLHAKYNETEQPQAARSNYHDAVWLVIYAYLLTQRSSYFDKKSFITQTIIQLAATYNISYENLLTRLTADLDVFQKKLTIPSELFRLLASLQKELSEKRLKESFIDAAKFYQTLYQSIKKEPHKQVSADSREGLIRILANPYTCRQFLQQLTEPEIIRLVPLVIPHDSDFVIEVAKAVESGETRFGGNQWRVENQRSTTANENHSQRSTLHSPLTKWLIIFPILLEKRDTRFNRKQFVRALLQQIAAHYNTTVYLLMESLFQQYELLGRTDKELKNILEELRMESGETKFGGSQWKMKSSYSALDAESPETYKRLRIKPDMTSDIEKNYTISDSHSELKKILHSPLSTLHSISEPQRYRLIQQMYPNEQEFIISYIKSLDKLHERSTLEAKAGGNFADVKWMFLFTVLNEMPADSFNRRTFVSRILQQIAAHYNLTYFDLLHYFHQEKTGMQLPFHLEQLLDELYTEEQEHWLEIILRSESETVKYQYLSCIKEIDAAFVKTFLQTLDHYHNKSSLQGKTAGCLNELKWRFVFEVLLKFPTIAFNKKQFVRHTLVKMAAHYQLSLYELLAYLQEISAVSANTYSKEIEKIIQELYREQPQSTKEQKNKKAEMRKQENTKFLPNNISLENSPLANAERWFSTLNWLPPTVGSQFINNAGVVLLTPYLPRLFSMLDLIENNNFKDDEAQIKAIYLIQFIVFGTIDFPEHEMFLNKLLTGFETKTPLPHLVEFTEKEIDTTNSMLHAALQHWNKLKNTSIDGLREGFLQREGKWEEKEDFYQLTVAEKAYDMLLDSCPWNFRTIKFPWMEKTIQVRWR